MPSAHAKLIRISAAAFKRLSADLKENPYSPRRRQGFLIDDASGHRLEGRYIFTRTQKLKHINPQTFAEEVVEQPLVQQASFQLNLTSGVILCRERRADLVRLKEEFDGIEGVQCEMDDFASDTVAIFKALRDAHAKVDLRGLRIKDYLGREHLLTTANFKLMEPTLEEQIFTKYHDQIQGFTASVLTEEGRQSISVGRKGSIRYSDDLPGDLLEMALNLLPQHHEQVEVETVEV